MLIKNDGGVNGICMQDQTLTYWFISFWLGAVERSSGRLKSLVATTVPSEVNGTVTFQLIKKFPKASIWDLKGSWTQMSSLSFLPQRRRLIVYDVPSCEVQAVQRHVQKHVRSLCQREKKAPFPSPHPTKPKRKTTPSSREMNSLNLMTWSLSKGGENKLLFLVVADFVSCSSKATFFYSPGI